MIWLLTRMIVWPVKVGAGSAKVGYKTGRVIGYKRVFVFGLGVAVGLLIAPTTGATLRRKLMALVDGDIANDPVPAEFPVGRDHVVDLTTQVAR
jgi:hypothetical protein